MKNVIVAVSGGPDSMALLDMLRQNDDLKCIIAHVNYQQRDTAIRDQELVEAYGKKYNIECHIKVAPKKVDGNFQSFAREFRYDFFGELAHQYNADEVYVAHHQDDLLETYIMQTKRNITPNYFGLNDSVNYDDFMLKRPLLGMSKQDLIDYCHTHNIEYGVDESNLQKSYLRNRVRLEVVEKMTPQERQGMLDEIVERNSALELQQITTDKNYEIFNEDHSIEFLQTLTDEEITHVLRKWLESRKIHNISQNELYSIIEFIESAQGSKYMISEKHYIFNDYGHLEMAEFAKDYEYIFSDLDAMTIKDYGCFKLSNDGETTEAVTLNENDFPVTIRNFRDGDKIKLSFGTKSVSRWFIDREISLDQRDNWPVVLNDDGEVILVPGIGCNIDHYSTNPTIFVVK